MTLIALFAPEFGDDIEPGKGHAFLAAIITLWFWGWVAREISRAVTERPEPTTLLRLLGFARHSALPALTQLILIIGGGIWLGQGDMHLLAKGAALIVIVYICMRLQD